MPVTEFLPNIWLLIVLIIPISLLIIGTLKLRQKESVIELVVKFVIAKVLYLFVTIFSLVYIASVINSIEDAKGVIIDGNRSMPSMDYQTLGLFLSYCLFGAFLCWFLNADLSKSLKKIVGDEKPKIELK